MPKQNPGTYSYGAITNDCHNGYGRIQVTNVQTDGVTSVFYNLYHEGDMVGAYAFPTNTTNGSTDFINLPDGLIVVEASANGGNVQTTNVFINCGGSGGSGSGEPAPCSVTITGVTVTPGDGESAATATVNAYGTGPLEYALNNGAWQSSPSFTVTPGTNIAAVRVVGTTDCNAVTSFLVSAPDAMSVTGPVRNWLPVGQPIYYTFQSPDAEPGVIEVNIEVSSNGLDFNASEIVGTVVLPPDNNGQYRVNVAPYLEATFAPGPPILSGVDANLYRLYRLNVGLLTTPAAHCLYAEELTSFTGNTITLSRAPYGYSNASYPGIMTEVDTFANAVVNIGMPYSGQEVCPKHPLHLYWLNRFGGWQSWVFDGKHEEGQEVGEAVLWQDAAGINHVASIESVAETVNVYSGFIPLAAYDTVFGILSAIRVYHRDNGRFREVNLETGSFQRHKAGQRRKELNFSFTYAQPLTVQRA